MCAPRVIERIDGCYQVQFNDVPTLFEEDSGIAVWTRRFILRREGEGSQDVLQGGQIH